MLKTSEDLAAHTASIATEIPKGWQLLQAHVIFRHGEKSFGNARNARAFPSYALQRPQDDDLTELGVMRMRSLGEQLRAFAERARLSVSTSAQASLMCCNPKPDSRHQHSLQEVAGAFWPQEPMPVPNVRHYDITTSEAPCRAEQMREVNELWQGWRFEHAAENDPVVKARPGVAALVEEATRLLSQNSQWVPGMRNGPMHHLAIRLAYALQHGEPLPPHVTAADYARIACACHQEDFQFFEQQAPARLYAGPFLGELLDTIRHIAGQPPARGGPCGWLAERGVQEVPSLLLYASHDYGVGPLAAALGAPFAAWPDVGSFLLLEVLRHDTSGEVSLRLTRNSQLVPRFLGLQAGDCGMVPWADAMPRLAALSLDSDGSPLALP